MSELSSKDAALKVGNTAIGHLKNVTVGHSKTVLKEYDIAGGDPSLLEPFESSYPVSAEWGHVDKTNYELLDTEQPDIVMYPDGTAQGQPTVTVAGCVLSWELSGRKGDPVILERVTGEGKSLTWGTVP